MSFPDGRCPGGGEGDHGVGRGGERSGGRSGDVDGEDIGIHLARAWAHAADQRFSELSRRGHAIHLRTLSAGVEVGRRFGFATDTIDARIEAIEHDDWKASNPPAALKRAFAVFGRRASAEIADVGDAIARVEPDELLIDMMCWGALSAAEAGDMPLASFSPFTPALHADVVPPFGPGLSPLPNLFGRVRDAVIQPLVSRPLNSGLPRINRIRDELHLRPVGSMDEYWRRAPLMLAASGKPFEYPHTEWGDAVQMIGSCSLDPAPVPDWLASIGAGCAGG